MCIKKHVFYFLKKNLFFLLYSFFFSISVSPVHFSSQCGNLSDMVISHIYTHKCTHIKNNAVKWWPPHTQLSAVECLLSTCSFQKRNVYPTEPDSRKHKPQIGKSYKRPGSGRKGLVGREQGRGG